jgi:hypothetical protein
MKIAEVNLLNRKAETKKDGVYSFRGNLWAVKNNKFIAYINQNGRVLQRFGAFDKQAIIKNNLIIAIKES